MIIDLEKFLAAERPVWREFEETLAKMEEGETVRLNLDQVQRFHYLHQRVSGDLARIMTFAAEPRTRVYLESLVARAYAQVHEVRYRGGRRGPLRWFFRTFPRTFRRHVAAFWITVAVTLAGCAFGAGAVLLDPEAKEVLLPYGHGEMNPSERVKQEESAKEDHLAGAKVPFSAFLMTHNTRVSILTLALGMTWGVGTIIVLFSNGVMLGGIVLDYVQAGQASFLAGWLLPHGSIEIPAILLAGQAGLVLAAALIGWGSRVPLRERLSAITSDLTTLIGGVAILLVWAGIIEAFFSQYHEPVLPYAVKISFGLVELTLLALFLSLSGRGEEEGKASWPRRALLFPRSHASAGKDASPEKG